MKKSMNILCFLSMIFLTFNLSGCTLKDSDDIKAQDVIKKYVTTYYTIDNSDINTYEKITSGTKDIYGLDTLTKSAGEKFMPFMTDAAYQDLTASRMSYGRIKMAHDKEYNVTVKDIKLEKDSEDKEKEVRVYYYDIELTQTSILGNETKSVKDKQQITVSKINDDWKVEHFSANDGYGF